MSRDPDFEASADMRLLELQRSALGKTAQTPSRWISRAGTDAAILSETPIPQLRGAVLHAALSSTPTKLVIPGAVVTISLAVANGGGATAEGISVGVPLPGGCAYRPGSLERDGRALGEADSESFFGAGLRIPILGGGARTTFLWKLDVKAGLAPINLVVNLSAQSAAALTGMPLRISRASNAAQQGAFAVEVRHSQPTPEELPFYELDDEEALVHEAANAALSSAAPPLETPTVQPPAPAAPAPSEAFAPAPLEAFAPAPPVDVMPPPSPHVPATIAPPVPAPPPPVETTRMALMLCVRIDRASIAYFERTLAGSKAPTLLAHAMLSGALACRDRLPEGDDPAGLRDQLADQAQLLQRLMLHAKLGRKDPISEYAGPLTARLSELEPAALDPAFVAPRVPGAITLGVELTPAASATLAALTHDSAQWSFLRGRQLVHTLAARRLLSEADSRVTHALEAALGDYARLTETLLQRLFVRLRVDRSTAALFQTDPNLDGAAQRLIALLGAAFP